MEELFGTILRDIGQQAPDATWEEDRWPRAIHRRRLVTDDEWRRIGPLRDIRGTGEAQSRIERTAKAMRRDMAWLAQQEPEALVVPARRFENVYPA